MKKAFYFCISVIYTSTFVWTLIQLINWWGFFQPLERLSGIHHSPGTPERYLSLLEYPRVQCWDHLYSHCIQYVHSWLHHTNCRPGVLQFLWCKRTVGKDWLDVGKKKNIQGKVKNDHLKHGFIDLARVYIRFL